MGFNSRQPSRRCSRRGLLQSAAVGLLGGSSLALLAACGATRGGREAQGGGGGGGFTRDEVAQKVEVVADPEGLLRWTQDQYMAQAGDVTFIVKNPSSVMHQFGVERNGVNAQSPNVGPNTTNSYTLKGLQAGEYVIVCNFPGHRQAGMIAKLVVT